MVWAGTKAGQEVADSDTGVVDRQVEHSGNQALTNSLLLVESGTDDLLSEEPTEKKGKKIKRRSCKPTEEQKDDKESDDEDKSTKKFGVMNP